MARIVLSDASPLIILARIDGLVWLHGLFGQVRIPAQVHAEILPGQGKPGESDLQAAIGQGWLSVLEQDWPTPELPTLDEGEAACIRAALNLDAPCLILMDERLGRAVAKEHGIAVVGVAGLVGVARKRGLIESAAQIFDRLSAENFRISTEVIRAVLRDVGEQAD